MLDALSLLWKRFSPLEERLLAEARTALPHDAREVFDAIPGPRAIAFSAWDTRATAALLADPRRVSAAAMEPEALPSVWLQVLARHRGQLPTGWLVHDETTAYRLAMGEAEYLILGERSGEEFILHRVEPGGAGLFYQESHDAPPELFEGDVEALIAGRPTTGSG